MPADRMSSSYRRRAGREITFGRCLDMIERVWKRAPGRLLDIGTGGGSFPYIASKRGWKAEGCEPNRWLCEWALENYGLPIRPGTVFDQKYPAKSYDVVTLWDVLEHTPDPKTRSSRDPSAVEGRRAAGHQLSRHRQLDCPADGTLVGVSARRASLLLHARDDSQSCSKMPGSRSSASGRIFSVWRWDTSCIARPRTPVHRRASPSVCSALLGIAEWQRAVLDGTNARHRAQASRQSTERRFRFRRENDDGAGFGREAAVPCSRRRISASDLQHLRVRGSLAPCARAHRAPAVPALEIDIEAASEIRARPSPTGTSWTPRSRRNVGLGVTMMTASIAVPGDFGRTNRLRNGQACVSLDEIDDGRADVGVNRRQAREDVFGQGDGDRARGPAVLCSDVRGLLPFHRRISYRARHFL